MDSDTPLHFLSGSKSSYAYIYAQALLENGADPNQSDKQGITPVFIAAYHGRVEMLRLLLMNGGNPFVRDYEDNWSPRDAALNRGHDSIVKLLDWWTEGLKTPHAVRSGSPCTFNSASCSPRYTPNHHCGDRSAHGTTSPSSTRSYSPKYFSSPLSPPLRKLCFNGSTDRKEIINSDTKVSQNEIQNNSCHPIPVADVAGSEKALSVMSLASTTESPDPAATETETLTPTSDKQICRRIPDVSPAVPSSGQKCASTSRVSTAAGTGHTITIDDTEINLLNETLSIMDEDDRRSVMTSVVELLDAEDQNGKPPTPKHANYTITSTTSVATQNSIVKDADAITAAINTLTNQQLREQLATMMSGSAKRHANAGLVAPITNDVTRKLHAKKLLNLILGSKTHPHLANLDVYSKELANACKGELVSELARAERDEVTLSHQFSQDPVAIHSPQGHTKKGEAIYRVWREGRQKTSFCYLLIDPRRLYSQAIDLASWKKLSETLQFETFIMSIFYVGKAKRSRPHEHLFDAIEAMDKFKTEQSLEKLPSDKLRRIIEIWKSDRGVISLHVFQNIIPVDAYTREAAMIDAIRLPNLTNIQRGNFYGHAANWTVSRQRSFGVLCLQKAMSVLKVDGVRFGIRPDDIRKTPTPKR